ncbi:hypothetical protein CCZ01_08525 [Helicobacter monodelphidis]|uniref:M48 family metallopeptidase n=1 Tax=Helicobacter sp. 15-1451 TaxID=2004995 RepID=UPI000DCCDCE7|nr:M48 family metallopeptidase [Helicobacter sp. 15-1451]RAX56741.1 hypothetical protein CCZ01_08525 [Helicobacter sp. 15-1451]
MLLLNIYICVYAIPKILVSLLQIFHVRKKMQQSPILLPQAEFQQAGLYTLATQRLEMFETFFDVLVLFFLLRYGLFEFEAFLDEQMYFGVFTSTLYVLGVLFFLNLVKIPFELYKKFVIDKHFGFFRGNLKDFLIDNLKSVFLLFVFGLPIIFIAIFIITSSPYWWIYSALFLSVIIILINIFYPTLIAPLFNKFIPLEDEVLKTQIQSLMVRAGFSSGGVFVVDASRRDGRLNAYFGGFGKTKRVVLFDTLIQKVSKDELLAVLGHELGHFKHKDIYKNMLFIVAMLTFLLFIIAHIPEEVFLTESGISRLPHSIIAFVILFSPLVIFWLMPIFGFMSRHNEYQADKFGATLQSAESLRNALLVLVNENKSFPSSHPIYIFFYYTHPPLLQRLKALGFESN